MTEVGTEDTQVQHGNIEGISEIPDIEGTSDSSALHTPPPVTDRYRCGQCGIPVETGRSLCGTCRSSKGSKSGLSLLVIFLLVAGIVGIGYLPTDNSPSSDKIERVSFGETAENAVFRLKMFAERRKGLGPYPAGASARRGHQFLVLRYELTNTSGRDISWEQYPVIKLVLPDGQEQLSDLESTALLAIEKQGGGLVASTLKSGEQGFAHEVFEVPESVLDSGNWHIVAEGRESFQFSGQVPPPESSFSSSSSDDAALQYEEESPKSEQASLSENNDSLPLMPSDSSVIVVAGGQGEVLKSFLSQGEALAAWKKPASRWMLGAFNPWNGTAGKENQRGSIVFIKTPSGTPGGLPLWDIVMWDWSKSKYEPIAAAFPAKDLTFGASYHQDFRDIEADGLPIHWSGSRLTCKLERVRSKNFVPQYVACLSMSDPTYLFRVTSDGILESDLNGDGLRDMILPLDGRNRVRPEDRITKLILLTGDVSGLAPSSELVIGVHQPASGSRGMDFADASTATGLTRRIESVTLVGDKVVARAKEFAPEDKPCCPSIEREVHFQSAGGQLVEVASSEQPSQGTRVELPSDDL